MLLLRSPQRAREKVEWSTWKEIAARSIVAQLEAVAQLPPGRHGMMTETISRPPAPVTLNKYKPANRTEIPNDKRKRKPGLALSIVEVIHDDRHKIFQCFF
jgi:hypothetical protein